MSNPTIHIKGARTNNLKNISLDIPTGKLVVITGLSGSGKSSLAFDTLYAEGQRRYVESLSAYARQFLGRMQKPEVDFISGIPPAIAIEQKTTTKNPRSTVGTASEIYDYLKLLFARVGHTISPISGQEVKRHTVQDVVAAMQSLPQGTRLMLLAPIQGEAANAISNRLQGEAASRRLQGESNFQDRLTIWQSEGFTRLLHNGEVVYIADLLKGDYRLSTINYQLSTFLLIDRIVADQEPSTANRFADSVQTAFFEGQGCCAIYLPADNQYITFSTLFEADGISFAEPTRHLFDFNSPLGACPTCNGFGNILGIDPELVVPDKTLSIYEGAIACWHGEVMSQWQQRLILNAHHFDFPIHTPFYQLTDEQKQLIWTGNQYFSGLNDFFKMLAENQGKVQYRVMLARYRGKTLCPDCLGSRLRKEANYVRIGDKSITDLVQMPVSELLPCMYSLPLSEHEQLVAKQLLHEIISRLQFMQDVGLGYLTLNRLSGSLSGGESQRLNLAKSLGSSLVGSLYVLDEPSIGLHPRDTERLIRVLHSLRDLGNTVVVVEHDEDIMRAADYIIDIGPEAGQHGGEVVFSGNVKDLKSDTYMPQHSYTVDFLTGKERIPIPPFRRAWTNYIEILGATGNNLKAVNVRVPLNVLTVVTGVSGSGKSSLITQVLYPALRRHFGLNNEHIGSFSALKGSLSRIKAVEAVDQNPIGTSTRSNPVTYIKAYDDIRALFADQQLSQQMGFTAGHFSFNTPGGRCEECKGEGKITIPMQFMADLILECEHCHGRRFKQDILEVLYRGKSIHDILQMTVNEAISFFGEDKALTPQRIVRRLQALQAVGIGYLKLGQPSSTLSGGESQRVKLASFLAQEKNEPTLFIFDEPTTGLHYHDIHLLLKALNSLIAKGHTVVVIEHNPAVIMAADYVIDMGPEGGKDGGNIVFTGTPEMLKKCKESYTGRYLS